MDMNINTLFSVKDKVILVTGGGRGIGLMIAEGLVKNGAKVYISSRTAKVCGEEAARLRALGPGTCISLPADLSKQEHVVKLAAELSRREEHLDVLINNAGATWGEEIDTYPDGAFEKVMTLNVKRVFTLTQALLPLLRKGASMADPGRIINIGSVDGIRVPNLETYAYSTSKAALHHLSRHMAARLGHEGITVNTVAPGPFQSKMMAATLRDQGEMVVGSVPLGRIGQPQDMVGVCIYLSSQAGAYVNGALIAVDGGSVVGSKL